MMYSMLKDLQCIVGRSDASQQSKNMDLSSVQELFNLCPEIERLLNQIWQSGSQSKNLRFVLNRTFHVQVRSFSFELF